MTKVTKEVVVVGAGISGLVTGISLKKRLAVENFTIYEREHDVGGTWRDNTYPGCACDIRAHWYSYSEDQNPDWSSTYATRKDILDYWLHLVDKHKLRPHIQCNTELVGAEWEAQRNVWTCHFRTSDGKTQDVETKILVTCFGPFGTPSFPDIPGIDDYQGIKFHSGRWRHDIDLSHKRVAVFGIGASASQFVPAMTRNKTTQITHIIRTPTWFLPRVNSPVPDHYKWIFRNVPGILRLYRNYLYAVSDVRFLAWIDWLALGRAQAEKGSLNYIYSTAPEKYHKILTPNYTLGCKRVVLDPGYLKCLHSPNITVTADGVKAFTKDGIITKKGEHLPFDVVIFGTGFHVCPVTISIRGAEGLSLSEYYAKYHNRAPVAHLGTTVPTFPNFFMIIGPNVGTGHSSVLFAIETQVSLITQLIKPILHREISAIAIKRDVCNAYNEMIQRRLAKMSYAHCMSYYRLNMSGANVLMFPGPLGLLWWWSREPMWGLYELVGGEAWLRARRRRKLLRSFLWAVGILVVAVIFHPDLLKRVPFLHTRTQAFVQSADSARFWIEGLWERLGF